MLATKDRLGRYEDDIRSAAWKCDDLIVFIYVLHFGKFVNVMY